MKFCDQCQSIMNKNAGANGFITFTCRCGTTKPGQPEDTLMFEKHYKASESISRHEVFIEHAALDAAGNIVMRDCPKCRLNFMTLLRVGEAETTMLACSCGYAATQVQYMAER